MILLLLALLTPQVVMPAPARANASFVNRAINSDGTLNLSADLHGNLDLTGWQVKLDRQRGPILRPDRAPAAVPLLDLGVWSALGAGLDEMGGVSVIAINGSDVYVGGSFPEAIGVPDTFFIAKWDGSVWSALGAGLNGSVSAIAISGSDVYVGGIFDDAGGDPAADRIARWDGVAWFALGSGLGAGSAAAVAISGGEV